MAVVPLSGLKVLDLSRVLAGPLAAMVLGDMGANVVKVERPCTGDDTRDFGLRIGSTETTYYCAFNRNKRSVTADLATDDGRDLVLGLAAEADVVIENFRPGGMEKYGLGFEALRVANPGLVYCAITGYDIAGPEAPRPGYDLVIQGEAGLMAINGDANTPPVKFGVAAVDMFTGMYAAQAILGALLRRGTTGKGCRIDLALYDCGLMITSYVGLEALLRAAEPDRYGNDHPSVVPYGVFMAQDGPIVLAVGTNRQFHAVCDEVLGRVDIAGDERFRTNILRARHRDVLIPILNAEFARHPRRALLARLQEHQVPCGEVLGLHEALLQPRSADILRSYEHPVAGPVGYFAPPFRFDGERATATPPPRLGEHSAQIEAEGFGAAGDAGARRKA